MTGPLAALTATGTPGGTATTAFAGVATTRGATTTGATTAGTNTGTPAPAGAFPEADGTDGRDAFAVAVSTSICANVGMATTPLATGLAGAAAPPAVTAAAVGLPGMEFSMIIWAPVARACSVTRHEVRLRPRVGGTACAAEAAVIKGWGPVPASATGSSSPGTATAPAISAPPAGTGKSVGSVTGWRPETGRSVGGLPSVAGTTDWATGGTGPGINPAAAATATTGAAGTAIDSTALSAP